MLLLPADSFDDVLRAINNTFRSQASAAGTGTSEAALASGLTPLEAQGAGQGANLQVLQAMFPALAQVENQQSQVGVDLMSALTNLNQESYLPMLSQVMSPYHQAVAGETSTTETTDTAQRYGILADIASSLQSGDLQRQGYGLQRDLANQEDTRMRDLAEMNESLQRDLTAMSEAGATQRTGSTNATNQQIADDRLSASFVQMYQQLDARADETEQEFQNRMDLLEREYELRDNAEYGSMPAAFGDYSGGAFLNPYDPDITL